MNKHRAAKRCFTLLEMLIVITVIGILAGMLIPVINKARWHALNAKCKANLKNLQIAALNRAFDNDGRLPFAQSYEVWRVNSQAYETKYGWVDWRHTYQGTHSKASVDDSTLSSHTIGCTDWTWTQWWGVECWRSITNGTIWDYTGHAANIYSCPTFLKVVGTTDPWGGALTFRNISGVYGLRTYGMNSQVSDARISDLEPSKRLLFADMTESRRPTGYASDIASRCMKDNNQWAVDGELIGLRVPGQAYPYEAIGTYHNGKGNVIFVDGHVESLLWSQTTNACSGNW